MDMGDEYGKKWMERLPWVLLAKRTSYQPALKATPAEMVLGSNPTIPGDIIGVPGPPLQGQQLKAILDGLRKNAARPPVQTTHNRTQAVNYPNLDATTHVYIKRGKTTPLGKQFDGTFLILERRGKSCIKVKVGLTAKGEIREEIHHWSNCKPAVMKEDTPEASRVQRGRKPLNPQAQDFKPASQQATDEPSPEPVQEPAPQQVQTEPVQEPAPQQVPTEPDNGRMRLRTARQRKKPVRYQS